ncbi:hypothetical protein LPB136_01735 [Tenacibaculum todarodis]|uniref:HTH araC/xylS-type domain-containing protein n=1 Tax=Tenacibaculum todarodis TaxID=1850252 RepID=A0A1L3JGG1_9FLAO|nr:helix-turn-helix domain-containing protein [Tenacibaculum todarodis]APG64163.1 hypothetical protein LPB136_01735 [Tenacibaculum todarodis]
MKQDPSFLISQEITNSNFIKTVTKVTHLTDVENMQFFGYDNSYIIFNYGEVFITEKNGKRINSPKIYLKSVREDYFYFSCKKNTSYVVIVLNPCSFYNITGLNAHEQKEQYLTLNNYVKNDLLEEMYEEINKLEAAEKISTYFLKKMNSYIDKWNQNLLIDEIISNIIESNGIIQIDEILTKYNISASTANRYFKKFVGTTIGAYIRLVKFNILILALNTNKRNLQDIIAQYNYYDQTHLTKDFKKFSGVTPAEYKGPNHKLLQETLLNKKE